MRKAMNRPLATANVTTISDGWRRGMVLRRRGAAAVRRGGGEARRGGGAAAGGRGGGGAGGGGGRGAGGAVSAEGRGGGGPRGRRDATWPPALLTSPGSWRSLRVQYAAPGFAHPRWRA